MATCDRTRDCDRDQYVCRSAAQLNAREDSSDGVAMSADIAEVLDDKKSTKFCVVRE